jgi:ATP synthase protein I
MGERQPEDTQAPNPRRPGGGEDTSSWYRLAGIGFEFIVAVGLFGGLGFWLDRTLGTGPWLMVSGFGLGFATGLFLMVRAANRMFRD